MQQIGWCLHQHLDLGHNINISPTSQRTGRQVHLVFPAGHCARHGNAGAKDTGLQTRGQRGNQFGKSGADQRQRRGSFWNGEPVGAPFDHRPVKPHHHDIH